MSENLPNPPFAHLRLHTEFSINDGIVTIKPLIARLRENSMPAVAITDLANMFSLIKFYTASLKAGIKPVCGCDVLVESDDGSKQTRLVLLVKSQAGYLSLTKLISELYTENPSQSEPSVCKSQLAGRVDGLIALSGAQNSDIGQALLADEKDLAKELLAEWQQLFPENFYLELQRVGKAEEEDYIDAAVALAIETNTSQRMMCASSIRMISMRTKCGCASMRGAL
jgi:DNA polymerase-3 subunit alpha